MSITISDKAKCTGCSACYNVCPKGCIEMIEDKSGFIYPTVDISACVNCRLCENVCPITGRQPALNEPLQVYAAWTSDTETRKKSTSGGVFSELANEVIRGGGCVVGAVYTKDNEIEHVIVHNAEDIARVRQSKYAQSRINDVFRLVLDELKQRKVLFCGAPCQVAGLKNYLKKDDPNLITIDFICRGVNSPKALRAWISEIERDNASKVKTVWFKYKEDGWHASPRCTKIIFADGREKVYKGKDNLFMSGYLGPNLYIRPSCGECAFKGKNRTSDLTLGDFWGIEQRLDDDKGTSLVMTSSLKGEKLFQDISYRLVFERRRLDEITEGNVCFDRSVKINKNSTNFLVALDNDDFSALVRRYSKKSITEKVISVAGMIKNNVKKKGSKNK